jgi:hypothetical protein|tara:strand:+ start:118 stop:267 length:150 start_codon:yes stop_codon:yes gene_type:complete
VVLKNICKINPYKTTIAKKSIVVLPLKPLLINVGTNGPKKTKNTTINSI